MGLNLTKDKNMKRTCKECKKPFEGRKNKIFCFIKCQSKFHAKRRDWKKANYNRNRGRLKQFYCPKIKMPLGD